MKKIKEDAAVNAYAVAAHVANVVTTGPIALAASLFMPKKEAAEMMEELLFPGELFEKEK